MKLLTLEDAGKAFTPEKIRPHIRKHLLKAGITEVPYRLFGALFYVSIMITILLYLWKVYPILEAKESNVLSWFVITFVFWILCLIVITAFFMLTIYSYVDIIIFNRLLEVYY